MPQYNDIRTEWFLEGLDLAEKNALGVSSSTDTNFAPQLPEADSSATVVTDITNPTLTKEWDKFSENIARIGGNIVQAGENLPDSNYITSDTISPAHVVSFLFYGDVFEIRYKVLVGSMRVLVDGKPAAKINLPSSTGQERYMRVSFPDSRLRRIDIVSSLVYTGNLRTDPTDTVQPTLNPSRVIIAGDSFTEGTAGASEKGKGYVDLLRMLSGNFNIVQSGSGGTGWLRPNGERVGLVDRAQADIVDVGADVVIIAMGINDNGTLPDIEQAINDTLDIVQAGLPDATIVLLGSFTKGEANTSMQNNTALIEAAATARGLYFVNPTGTANGDGWITGTGNDGNLQGDGNADIFVSSDGTHPNDAGHEFHAQRLYNALLALGIKL
ncbi:MAG: putative GDSL-like lipase/acylhydrolase family protein [Prokaryotic dsDNA virus sp.]|nr:MAG: putative GDSL-like lipase/acylhydrolase family protein [Prokaryotic dsDNA virus sp.]|tara:strand:- start:16544 stop:17695 length:1152 start_codon:yes stop_codon:yes gene_type:complete